MAPPGRRSAVPQASSSAPPALLPCLNRKVISFLNLLCHYIFRVSYSFKNVATIPATATTAAIATR